MNNHHKEPPPPPQQQQQHHRHRRRCCCCCCRCRCRHHHHHHHFPAPHPHHHDASPNEDKLLFPMGVLTVLASVCCTLYGFLDCNHVNLLPCLKGGNSYDHTGPKTAEQTSFKTLAIFNKTLQSEVGSLQPWVT